MNGMFTINVIPEVKTLWKKIGTSEDQQQQDIQNIANNFLEIYQNYVHQLNESCVNIKNTIVSYQNKYIKAHKAYGTPDEEIPAFEISDFDLKNQLNEAKSKYDAFMNSISDRLEKLENLSKTINQLYDLFETPNDERGEFISVGDSDFTLERVSRFENKINEMNDLIELKKKELENIKQPLQNILNELNINLYNDENVVFNSNLLSEKHIQQMKELYNKYETFKNDRIKELQSLAKEITQLWDLLKIPDSERTLFLSNHSKLDENAVLSCKSKLQQLIQLRNQKLPDLINEQQTTINNLCDILHIPVELRLQYSNNESLSDIDNEVLKFTFYESEVKRLNKLVQESHSLIELISQRDAIINEYNTVQESSQHPKRLMSREKGSAQQLIKEEKANRRYKVILPKIEMKIYAKLLEFKIKNGVDFQWDGKSYIDNLSHIPPNHSNVTQKYQPKKILKDKAKSNKERTLPPSPRKVQIIDNEKYMKNIKSFSIRYRSPMKI